MHFNVNIYITSGKGGNGFFDFFKRVKKKMDGGNGGNGGNVYVCASENFKSLEHLIDGQNYKAENGFDGKRAKKNGKDGNDLRIYVPIGTKIYDNDNNLLLSFLNKDNESLLVLKGGKKGFGSYSCRKNIDKFNKNIYLGSSANIRFLRIELSLCADVAIFGFPNVGKSTFLNLIANSKYKTADYIFTTLSLNFGVLKLNDKFYSFIDLPGIIKNASKGVGLGLDFLQYLSDIKVLLHFIDISLINNLSFFMKDIYILNNELMKIKKNLFLKDKWLIFNKVDKSFEKYFFLNYSILNKYNYKKIFYISAKSNIGVKKLSYAFVKYL